MQNFGRYFTKNKHLNILAMKSVRALPNCYKFALNEIFLHQTSLSIRLEQEILKIFSQSETKRLRFA